jgi:hypothetical protein
MLSRIMLESNQCHKLWEILGNRRAVDDVCIAYADCNGVADGFFGRAIAIRAAGGWIAAIGIMMAGFAFAS